jgi:ABC-type dipeptide/oligopeptide/nickel transport system permease subunit
MLPSSADESRYGGASNARLAWSRFTRNRLALFGLAAFVVLALLAIFGPLLPLPDPLAQDLAHQVQPPSLAHPLGTDTFGRDVLSRVITASRLAFLVGIGSASLGVLAGLPIGSLAGYYGGWIDVLAMRFADTVLTFPAILLALVVVGSVGPSLLSLVLTFGIVFSPRYMRLARASALQLRSAAFVQAALGTGANDMRILTAHILPNSLGPIFVQYSANFAYAIVAEASLSFLGLGIRPPDPSWGTMISEARSYIFGQPWLLLFPAAFLVSFVLGLNFLGDGLRDALDPRTVT